MEERNDHCKIHNTVKDYFSNPEPPKDLIASKWKHESHLSETANETYAVQLLSRIQLVF